MNRLELVTNSWVQRIGLWCWKIGLGWLVGRRFVLLGTHSPSGGVRRSLVPFVMFRGDLYLAAHPGAHWVDDVTRRPVANAQAHPGPLAVQVAPVDPDDAALLGDLETLAPDLTTERWFRATSTGDVVPEMVPPDHVWVWGIPIVWWLLRR